jgi:hypothetical protein
MTSSTSSSEPDAADARRWRRWIAAFAIVFFGVGGLIYGVLLLIDPYDSDRFPNFGIAGVDDRNPRTADVSRGRDERFDSAIIGNSTGQLLDPGRLDPATGLRFVQLTIPQTGPREQLAIMRWVVSHHDGAGALVLVADDSWCSPDTAIQVRYPFPFWLYGGDGGYLANVLNWKSFDRAVWRVQLALGQRHRVDPVGYSDYSPLSLHPFQPNPPAPPPPTAEEARAGFPWVEALRQFVAALPPGRAMVVVMPPVEASLLPQSGSPLEARMDRCKQAIGQVLAGRPRSGFLDFRTDSPWARDRGNFFDRVHYRDDVARAIEARIIGVLGRTATARE